MTLGYIYVIRPVPYNETRNFYIGSTSSFKKRVGVHRNDAEKKYTKLSEYIKENGGWERFDIYVMFQIEYQDKLELRILEQQYIDYYRPSLNTNRAVQSLIAKTTVHKCACGGQYTKNHQFQHTGSKKHIRYVLKLQGEIIIALSPKK